jgi:hypothetical protein
MYMPTLKRYTRPRTIGKIPFVRERFTVLAGDTTQFDPFGVDLAVDEGWGRVVRDGDEGAVVKVEAFAAGGVDAESGLRSAEEGAYLGFAGVAEGMAWIVSDGVLADMERRTVV